MEYTAIPMCLNSSKTLFIDAPAAISAKLDQMLPAGNSFQELRVGCATCRNHRSVGTFVELQRKKS